MRPDQSDADRPQSQGSAMSEAAKRLRRLRTRAVIRPTGRQGPNQMITSFGMIIGLLGLWAMTVNF
jgi:hypothetical protein